MRPPEDFVKLVLCNTYHQVCADDAAAHPATAQEREAAEHLALGDVWPCSECLSDSLSEFLVVSHGEFRSRTCKRILIRARTIHRRNWNIEQAQVYEELPAMVIPMVEQERP